MPSSCLPDYSGSILYSRNNFADSRLFVVSLTLLSFCLCALFVVVVVVSFDFDPKRTRLAFLFGFCCFAASFVVRPSSSARNREKENETGIKDWRMISAIFFAVSKETSVGTRARNSSNERETRRVNVVKFHD